MPKSKQVRRCSYCSSQVHIEAILKPEDAPFVIIPSTFEPGIETSFHLYISGKDVIVYPLPQPSWNVQTVQVLSFHLC